MQRFGYKLSRFSLPSRSWPSRLREDFLSDPSAGASLCIETIEHVTHCVGVKCGAG